MNANNRHHDEDGLPEVTNRFRDDLRAVFRPASAAPDEIDTRIAAEARTRLARRRWPWITAAASIAAAAAAVALVVTLNWPDRPSPMPMAAESVPPPSPISVADPHDIDGNGRVDVLDAFLLARQLKRSRDVKEQYDVTADGRIDHADVEAIARAAVRLNGGISS